MLIRGPPTNQCEGQWRAASLGGSSVRWLGNVDAVGRVVPTFQRLVSSPRALTRAQEIGT